MTRVVITGFGAISPIGVDIPNHLESLKKGSHGLTKIDRFDPLTKGCKTTFCAAIPSDFDPAEHSPFKEMEKRERTKYLRKLDLHQVYALVAAGEAIAMANLNGISDDESLDEIGVNIATGAGGLAATEACTILTEAGKKQTPFNNLKFLPNIAAGYISSLWDFRGPNNSHSTACAAGSHSIIDSYNAIILGEAKVMIAGGAEAAITPVGISTFNAQTALSTRNDDFEVASRPFTKDRDGFVMGEGSGCLVLEEYEHAKARGAHIYAELVGYGRTGDGATGGSITAPHPKGRGGKRAMIKALKQANRDVSEVDYVNGHSTSTGADSIEIKSIIEVLGSENAEKTPVSGTKSFTGHLLGASGALEAVFSVMSIENNLIPFTNNLTPENLDDECKGVQHVFEKPLNQDVNFVLSNSFGFGGTNACLAFSSVKK